MALFHRPWNDPCQPQVVSVGAVLEDGEGKNLSSLSLIRDDAPESNVKATLVHGLTTEVVKAYGLPGDIVLGLFLELVAKADLIVAHNLQFDRLVTLATLHRLGLPTEPLLGIEGYCTMEASTPILKLHGRHGYKWPSLQEAHKYFFDTSFEHHHDAMADTLACQRIYHALNEAKEKEDFSL